MNTRLKQFFFAWVVASARLLSAAASDSTPPLPAPPADLITSAHALDPAQPAKPWKAILDDLRKKGDIAANFTENRYLPLKKIPVVFTGEIRLSHEHGLSLHYLTPEERMIIVDAQGVQLRRADGHSRDLASDPRAAAATGTLLQVMRFDLAELSKQFATYASGSRDLWFFGFEPKDEAIAKSLSRILVTGTNDQVRRIGMRKGAVEILIHEVKENVTFTPDELHRFFR